MDFNDVYSLMNSPWGPFMTGLSPLDPEYDDGQDTSLSSNSPGTPLSEGGWRQTVSSASHVGAQSISSPITGSPQQTSTPLPDRNRRSEDENGDRQSEEEESGDRGGPVSRRRLSFDGVDALTPMRVLSSTTEKLNEEKIRAHLDRCLKAPTPQIELPGWRAVEVTPDRIVWLAPERLQEIARTLCAILQPTKSEHLTHTSQEVQLAIGNTFNDEASLAAVRELLKYVQPARETNRTIRDNTQDASARKPKFRDVVLGVKDAVRRLNTEQLVIEAFVDGLRDPEADEPLYVNLKQHELREAVRENQRYNTILFFSDDDNEMRKNQIIESPNEANGIFEILLIKYQKKLFEEFGTLLKKFIDLSTGAFVEKFAEEYNRFIEEDDAQSETSSVTEYEFALGEANYEAACRVHDELCQLVRKDARLNERSFFGARNEDLCQQMKQSPAKSIEILDALFAYYQNRAFDNFETCLNAYVEGKSGRFVPDFGLSEEDELLVIDERQLGDYKACLLLMDKLAPRFDNTVFGGVFDKSNKLIIRQIQKYPRAVRAFYLHLEALVYQVDNFPLSKKTTLQEIKTLARRYVNRIGNSDEVRFNKALLALEEEEIYYSRLSGGAACSEESRKILASLEPRIVRDLPRAYLATQDSNAVNAPQELSVVSKGRQKRPLDLESSNVMTVLRRLYEVPPRLSLGFKPSSDYIGVILPDSMLWVSPERLRDLVRAVLRSGGMYREEDHHALSILPPDGPTSQLVEYHVTEEQPGFDPVLSFAPQYSGNGDEFVSSAAVSPSHTTSLNEELSRILPAFGFVPEPGVPRLGDPGPQGPKEPQAPRMHESDRARPLPGTGPKPVERSKKVAVPPPLGKVARQAAPVEAKSTWQSFKDRYIVVQDADPFILQVMKVAVRILALIAFPLTLALRLAFSFYDRCIAERVRPDGSFVPPVGARA